jgi:hypothetical protein
LEFHLTFGKSIPLFKNQTGEKTMSRKTTIHIPTKADAVLAAFGADSTSGVLATIVERYDRITREAIPELTLPEWSAICDALNGCNISLSGRTPDPAPMAWAEILDSEPEIGKKWNVDCQALAEKLRALPFVGKIAVWDIAARFWSSPRNKKASTAEVLREIGVKLAE